MKIPKPGSRPPRGRQIEDIDRTLTVLLSNLRGLAYRCKNDPSWTMEFVSEGCLELTGYKASDLVGNRTISYGDLIHAEDRGMVNRCVQEGIKSRSSFQLEYRIIAKDGRERWVWEKGTPIFDADGRLEALEGFITDITDRKEAERRLRESEERYRLLAEYTTDLVCIHEPDGRFNYVSPSSEDVLGYKPEELVGRDPYELAHPEDKRRIRETSHGHLINGAPYAHVKHRMRRKDGKYIWLDTYSVSVFGEEGELKQIVCSTRDITEQKAYEQELVDAREEALEMSRLKSSFLANMSHEIRTPLTSVLGFASILAEELPEESKTLVRYIQNGGERLMATLNSVLDLSMLESGSVTLRPEVIDVADAAQKQLDMLSVQAASKGLQLRLHATDPSVRAYLDRQCLDRIVMNLVGNAIKFTENGHVSVSVRSRGDSAEIIVADTGIGIDETFMPLLFKEFQQESSGMARHYEGVGLGLAITKSLVDLFEGEIAVDSERGRGSTFSVTLPCHLEKAPAEQDARVDVRLTARPHKHRILALDDNEQMLRLIERFLKDYEVETFSTEQGLLDTARNSGSDVVLLDINLGDNRNGIDVLKALRRLRTYQSTPVLAVTAYALPEDKDRFLEEGFNDYLPKPFDRNALVQTIERHVAA